MLVYEQCSHELRVENLLTLGPRNPTKVLTITITLFCAV